MPSHKKSSSNNPSNLSLTKKQLKVLLCKYRICFYVLPFLLLLMGCLFLRGWFVWISVGSKLRGKLKQKFQTFPSSRWKIVEIEGDGSSGIYVNDSLSSCMCVVASGGILSEENMFGMKTPFCQSRNMGRKWLQGMWKGIGHRNRVISFNEMCFSGTKKRDFLMLLMHCSSSFAHFPSSTVAVIIRKQQFSISFVITKF